MSNTNLQRRYASAFQRGTWSDLIRVTLHVGTGDTCGIGRDIEQWNFTFVVTPGTDDDHMNVMNVAVESSNGKVIFNDLRCTGSTPVIAARSSTIPGERKSGRIVIWMGSSESAGGPVRLERKPTAHVGFAVSTLPLPAYGPTCTLAPATEIPQASHRVSFEPGSPSDLPRNAQMPL